MKLEVNEKGELIFEDVFNAIGIKTETGCFGICQRDGGIEVVKDGKTLWSSVHGTIA